MRERDKLTYAVEVHAADESEVGGGTLVVSVSHVPGGESYVYVDGTDGWNFDASGMSVETAAALAEAFSGAVAAALGRRPEGRLTRES